MAEQLRRNYVAPEFKSGDTGQFQQRQVAQADTRPQTPMVIGDSSWKDRLLQDWGSKASGALQQLSEQSLVNEYLDGQAQAGIIKSEDELQGNVLTRDWKVAGYRDTMGKLALAESQANFKTDLVDLREKSGDELNAYLADRRAKLTPMLDSMSRESRAQVAGQLLLNDNADIATWKTQHAAYIMDVKHQSYSTALGMQLQTLRDTQTQLLAGTASKENYTSALRNVMGVLEMGVWRDSGLTTELKQSITTDALLQGLHAGQPDTYEYLRDNAIPNPDGTTGTILSRLSSEDQTKLGDAYTKSMQKTAGIRNMAARNEYVSLAASVESNIGIDPTELSRKANAMVVSGAISADEGESLRKGNLVNLYKAEQKAALVSQSNAKAIQVADAVSRGDTAALRSLGVNNTDAIQTSLETMTAAGTPPEAQVAWLLQSAPKGVGSAAYKAAGSMLAESITAMRLSDKPLTQHTKVTQTFLDYMQKNKSTANEGLIAGVLEGIPETDRAFAVSLFSAVRNGESSVDAVNTARTAYLKNTTATKAEKNAVYAATGAEVTKAIKEQLSTGMISSVFRAIKRSVNGARYGGLKDSLLGVKDPSADLNEYELNKAVTEEAGVLQQEHPYMKPEDVANVAIANVNGRVIPTRHNDIIVPKGADVATLFGVRADQVPLIGEALGKLVNASTADNTAIHFRVSEGKVLFDEVNNKTGQVTKLRSSQVDPRQLRAVIDTIQRGHEVGAEAAFGYGKSVLMRYATDAASHPDARNASASFAAFDAANTAKHTAKHGAARQSIKDLAATGSNDFDRATWGNRPDGTPQGDGFLGVLKRPDGSVASEYSVGVTIGGKEVDIPTLVPTLTRKEVQSVLALQHGAPPSKEIIMKAQAHAEMRLREGKSVYAQQGEQGDIAGRDPVQIQYNGDSTAGIDKATMLAFRDNLIAHEGLRDKAYKDLSGKLHDSGPRKGLPIMTVGVGVSSHNDYYPTPDKDGYVTPQQIQESFLGASNAAAVAGAAVARSNNFNNSAGILLFSELAYQSGTKFTDLASYQVVLRAMQSGNVDFAKHAFKSTPAWKWSGGDNGKRAKSYLNLIERSMTGG